jgi:acetyl-CoA carboxylase biotin carboxyl carrier protein
MHEIRAGLSATVVAIAVDEGQMVAEEDEILVLAGTNGQVSVVTDVPGVVRELHVALEDVVGQGDLIALIDES